MSQKELQRVTVISSCVNGALAHATRGRPSHRCLALQVRERILHLARTRYAVSMTITFAKSAPSRKASRSAA